MLVDSAPVARKNTDVEFEALVRQLCQRYPVLTLAQIRVCAHILQGRRSWEIGARLGIDEHAVESHRSRIRKKLGLTSGQHLETFLLHELLKNL
ncbi:MAG: hypothetical protein JSS75_11720 [Bacteroidetes bacterium]|nr:hypothetical protein [Bacteroidota bacterium]